MGGWMQMDPEDLGKIDPLALSNTVTLSALVALLVRKGVLTDAELVEEIRKLKEKIGAPSGQP